MEKIKLKFMLSAFLSAFSLSILALMGTQPSQINKTKLFLMITMVTLILGVMTDMQKYQQQH